MSPKILKASNSPVQSQRTAGRVTVHKSPSGDLCSNPPQAKLKLFNFRFANSFFYCLNNFIKFYGNYLAFFTDPIGVVEVRLKFRAPFAGMEDKRRKGPFLKSDPKPSVG